MNKINDFEAQSTLLGLGAFSVSLREAVSRHIGPQKAQVVAEIAQEQVQRAIQTNAYTRPQQIFAAKVPELSAQAKADIAQGNAKFTDGERYIAYKILSAAGTEELFRSKPQAEIGITNFDEGRMPAGTNMLVSALAIEFGSHATVTDVDNIAYGNILDAGALPTAIMNAEIEITAGGRVIVPSTPVSKFFSANGAAMGNAEGRRIVELQAPKLIRENEQIGIIIRKPANGALTAVNNFIKVSLLGPETSTK